MAPTRDPAVDGLTLADALATQGLVLEDCGYRVVRRWWVRKKRGSKPLFVGSNLDIWKWLFLRMAK